MAWCSSLIILEKLLLKWFFCLSVICFLIIIKIQQRQLYLEVFVVWSFVNEHGKIKANMWSFWPCISVFFSYDLEGRGMIWGMIFDFTKFSGEFFFCCCIQRQASPKVRRILHFKAPSKVFTYNLCVCVYVFAFFFKEIPQNLL